MFLGDCAVGFAAKRVVRRLSLAMLLAAAQLADVLWTAFVAAGLKRVRIDPGNTAVTPIDFISYPYSHSLMFLLLWGSRRGRRLSRGCVPERAIGRRCDRPRGEPLGSQLAQSPAYLGLVLVFAALAMTASRGAAARTGPVSV